MQHMACAWLSLSSCYRRSRPPSKPSKGKLCKNDLCRMRFWTILNRPSRHASRQNDQISAPGFATRTLWAKRPFSFGQGLIGRPMTALFTPGQAVLLSKLPDGSFSLSLQRGETPPTVYPPRTFPPTHTPPPYPSVQSTQAGRCGGARSWFLRLVR